jgi:hypothetical protein
MHIIRTGRGDYFFGWYLGYPTFTDDRNDAIRLSEDTLHETILALTHAGYAVTSLAY